MSLEPLPRAISSALACRNMLAAFERAGFAECSLDLVEAPGELPRLLLELIPRNAALPQRLARRAGADSVVVLVVHDGRSIALEAELPALVQEALARQGATGLTLTLRSLEPARALLEAHGLDAATQTRLLEDPDALAASVASVPLEVPVVPDEATPDPAQMERVLLGVLGRLRFRTYGTRSPEEVAARLASRLSRTLPAVARKMQEARVGLVALAALEGKPAAALDAAGELLGRAGSPRGALTGLRAFVGELGALGVAPARLELSPGATALDPSWSLEAPGHKVLARGGAFPFRGGRAAVALIRIEGLAPGSAAGVQVLVVPVSEAELASAHALAVEARASGLRAELDPSGRNLRSSLRAASRRGVALVAIVGEREAREGTVLVKALATEEQRSVSRVSAVAELVLWLAAPRPKSVEQAS